MISVLSHSMSGFGSSTIKELTTWANMRLTCVGHSCTNILTGIMEGETMKCFAESMYACLQWGSSVDCGTRVHLDSITIIVY